MLPHGVQWISVILINKCMTNWTTNNQDMELGSAYVKNDQRMVSESQSKIRILLMEFKWEEWPRGGVNTVT